jgi:membrane protein
VRDHNLTLVAAGVAFYAFLAFIPTLIAFVSIYGLVADPVSVTRQVHDVAAALPDEVQRFLVFQLSSITKADSGGVSLTLVIATVVALWSASGGIAALIAGIRIAREEDVVMGFVRKRALAVALTLGAIVFLGLVIFLTTVLPPLLAQRISEPGAGSRSRSCAGRRSESSWRSASDCCTASRCPRAPSPVSGSSPRAHWSQ